MGIYENKVYVRNNKGAWKLQSRKVENVPHSVSFWGRSNMLERKRNTGEKTYIDIGTTRTGFTRVVKRARTYVGKNRKEERTLITTSNKLPKKYK